MFWSIVNRELTKPEEKGDLFKVNEAVPIYYSVKMMANAWHMVPTSVILSY